MSPEPGPFQLEGVVHLLQPWDEPAADLEQLRERLGRAPDDVVFAHTLLGLLRVSGSHGTGMDDLSHWVAAVLQDHETAERMWFAAGSAEPRAGPTREAILGVLSSVPEKRRVARRAPEGGELTLLSAIPLTYRVGEPLAAADDVLDELLGDDASVWFHHLHEERWHTGTRPVLLGWLEASGASRAAAWLEESLQSAIPVELSRQRFRMRFRMSQVTSRLARETAPAPEAGRAAARSAARRLVRRITGEEPRR